MELPEGWDWTSFEELAEMIPNALKAGPFGSALKKSFYVPNGYKIYGQEQVINEDPHFGNYYIDETRYEELKSCAVKPGDILISLVGTIGKVLILPEGIEPGIINPRLVKLSLDRILVNNEYVKKYLESPSVRDYLSKLSHGGTMDILNLSILKTLKISLPPLNEQKRIVAAIEALRERSQKARSALSAIPELCDKFRQSVLAAAFRGDLTADWREQNPDVESASTLLERIRKEKIAALSNYKEPELTYEEDLPELPHTWTWAVPEALSAYESNAICAGPFGTIFKAKDFRDEGIPIIFLRHIAPGKYLTHKPGFMDVNKWEELFKPYSIWGGELLITKLGEPPGACAIYPENIGPAMVTPDVIKMSANRNGAESLYLMHYFNSEFSKKITFGVAYGVTRLRMNLSIFRSLPVPLAPLEEQREVCKVIQKFFQIADYVEQQHLNIENQLNQLDRSILAKAFRGELVEQDPNDEPASVLLERIRLDREQQMQGKIKKPGKKKRTGD